MQSEDEREMCTRTVYCTNIDKKVYHYVLENYEKDTFGITIFSLGIVDRSTG